VRARVHVCMYTLRRGLACAACPRCLPRPGLPWPPYTMRPARAPRVATRPCLPAAAGPWNGGAADSHDPGAARHL
jgi:hypothetical protein